MLAEDTWDGGSFLLGDEATGKIGGQHHDDVATYARGVAYMRSYRSTRWHGGERDF
jgi:hypothetical protein